MAFFSKKEPVPIEVRGEKLRCCVCQNDTFYKKRIQLNTSLMTLFKLDWLNKDATCFVCSECTHIIWFDS